MWRLLFIAFFIAHGAVHVAMWLTPASTDPNAPFNATHSWLLGSRRGLAVVVAVVATVLLAAAGIGLWAHAEWWRATALVGLAVSFVLMVVYFHPWFLLIQVINAGLFVSILWLGWPTEAMVGA